MAELKPVTLTRDELENFYKDKNVYKDDTLKQKKSILEILDDTTVKAFKIDLRDTYTFSTGLLGMGSVTHRIIAIGDSLFKNTKLTKIDFPYDCHIHTICRYAFSGSSLQDISLPLSLQTIEAFAFHNCKHLEIVKISKNVTTIGDYAFSGCTNLRELIVPETVKKIGKNAFKDVPLVRYDGDAEDVEGNYWGADCFRSKAIEEAEERAKKEEERRRDEEHQAEIKRRDDEVRNKLQEQQRQFEEQLRKAEEERRKNAENEALKAEEERRKKEEERKAEEERRRQEEERLRKEQEEQKKRAAEKIKRLEEERAKAQKEADEAIAIAKKMEEKWIRKENDKKLEEERKLQLQRETAIPCSLDSEFFPYLYNLDAIDDIKEPTQLFIPSELYVDADNYNQQKKYRINEISDGFFKNSETLEKVRFYPNSINKIGNCAFMDCKSLSSVEIGDGLTEIGEEAFKNCESLVTLTLPNSLKEIKKSAFENCKKIKADMPNDITQIGKRAFKNCEKIGTVIIPSSVETIEDRAFMGCSSLKKLVISEGVIEIGESAFEDCDKLERVEIPSSVTKIGIDAFLGVRCIVCYEDLKGKGDPWGADFVEWKAPLMKNAISKADEIAIVKSNKENKEKIASNDIFKETRYVFDKNLANKLLAGKTSITILKDYYDRENMIKYEIKKIGRMAFWECRGILESVTIPPFVEEIEESAFEGCTKLSSVNISSEVKKIGKNAFKDVPNIKYYGPAKGSPWGAEAVNGKSVNGDESYPTVSLVEKQDVKKDSNSLASMIDDDFDVI